MEDAEFSAAVKELETRIDRLQALYNQYFMGIEKIEPMTVRKNVDRQIRTMRRHRINHTATRFKFQSLVQRFNTLQTYWLRVSRQIEEGTYKRHMMRAQARTEQAARGLRAGGIDAPFEEKEEKAPEATKEPETPLERQEEPSMPVAEIDDPFESAGGAEPDGAVDITAALDDPFGSGNFKEEKVKPAPVKAPAPQKKPPVRTSSPSPTGSDAAVSEKRYKAVYAAYMKARDRTGEGAKKLSYDKVQKTLRSKAADYSIKHGGKNVDFKVVIKGGKAVI